LSWYEPQPRQKPKRLPRRRPIKTVPSGIGDQGIVGNWLFYYLKGGDHLHDFSPNNNHGTLNGPVWKDGSYGWALDFDGVDDYVTASGLLPSDSPVTISFWVKPNTDFNEDTGWKQFVTNKARMYVEYGEVTGELGWRMYDTATHRATYDVNLSAGSWYYITGTYDGTNIILYLNGEQVASTTGGWEPLDYPLTIATSPGQSGRFPNVTLDLLRIYNRALNSSEIQVYYNRTKRIFGL